jgi:hypothetical protein
VPDPAGGPLGHIMIVEIRPAVGRRRRNSAAAG